MEMHADTRTMMGTMGRRADEIDGIAVAAEIEIRDGRVDEIHAEATVGEGEIERDGMTGLVATEMVATEIGAEIGAAVHPARRRRQLRTRSRARADGNLRGSQLD